VIRALFAALAILLAVPGPAAARDLFESEDGEYRLTLRSSLKGSWLLSFPQDDVLLPETVGGAALFRLRFELGVRLTEHLSAQIAYEHRSLASSTAGLGLGLLPPSQSPPFRLAPLDWAVVDGAPSYVHRHELDRFWVALHFDFMELTVGRQAIGLGRGVLFSAIDVFSPFSPAEVDREWRRGVDAIHLELRIPDLEVLSGDLIVVFGNVETGELESWSMLGRLRAIVGDVDGELVVGRRAEDTMVGGALSATVGDAEVHGELAFFGTDGRGIDGGFLGTRAVVAKGLVGGSYNIDVLNGIRVVLEYHHSGFALVDVGRDPRLSLDPDFRRRLAAGHSQTLGQHTLALALSTDLVEELSASITWFQSLTDGSGMIAPGFVWVPSDLVTLVLTGLLPWGTTPAGGVPRSEYGSAPFTVFLQARFYD
jgi:hypothetical protein